MNKQKSLTQIDILALGAHPDDVDVGCGGLILKERFSGSTVGIVDFTQGEKGKGSPLIRQNEALNASNIYDANFRINLEYPDGSVILNEGYVEAIEEIIKITKPEIILLPCNTDIHPDHIEVTKIVETSLFNVRSQLKPLLILYYIIDYMIDVNIIVDITDVWEKKKEALLCFTSQYTEETSDQFIGESRAKVLGQQIKTKFAEGFISKTPLQLNSLQSIRNRLIFSEKFKS